MTTIIGIKSNTGIESVVFGADRQLSYEDEDGDLTDKRFIYKLIYGKTWLLGHAGGIDNDLVRFQRELSQPRRYSGTEEGVNNLIKQAITDYSRGSKFKEPHFIRVNYLNALAMRAGKDWDDLHEFILGAVTGEIVGMWEVDPFGNLKQPQTDHEFEYLAIGSGAERVYKYIENLLLEDKLGATEIDVPKAIDLVVESLHQAESDPRTGGVIDLAILTPNGIESYGKEFLRAITDATKGVVDIIKKRYTAPSSSNP